MRTFTVAFLTVLSVIPLAAQRAFPSHPVTTAAAAHAREVARVNGVSLTNARLDAALNALLPFESFHRSISPTKLDALRAKALDRIVDDELQYQEGQRTRIQIPDARVSQEAKAVQAKYGTRAALDTALAQSGATFEDLTRELRRSLTIDETFRQAVTAKCQVDRDEALAYFKSNPDRFVVPEQLHLYGITIGVEPSAPAGRWAEARALAQEVRRQILAGKTFSDLARQYSTDPTRTSGGDMGLLHRGALTEEFERAVRSLPVEQPSDVVQSLYGFHIVEIREVLPSHRMSFTDVATDVQRDLTEQRCDSMRRAWLKDLRARATVVLLGPAL